MLAHPSEEITLKVVQATGIATPGHWGPIEVRLQGEKEQQAVQWITGPDKISSNDAGYGSLGVKPRGDDLVRNRGAPQLDVQKLELEQQPASQQRNKEIQEAPRNPKERTQEAPPDPGENPQESPPDPVVETRGAPSAREEGPQEALPNPVK